MESPCNMRTVKTRKRSAFAAAALALLLLLPLLSGCGGADSVTSQQTRETRTAAGNGQTLKVSFLDVDQGDSTFIELPNGQCMLIDAGEAEYGDEILSYIKEEGYDRIDYLIATHPHSDHIGGMRTIVEALDIGAVYMPRVQTNTQVFEKLLRAVREKGLKIQTAKAGVEILEEGAVDIRLVAPAGDDYSDLNDYSAVVHLSYGEDAFLFMGDAEQRAEEDITQEIQADVLKVGHHGSEYSSGNSFLKEVSPDYAVISCGQYNKYGHPDQEVLEKLKKLRTKVFRTDRQGTIIMTSNGNGISVAGQNQRQDGSQSHTETKSKKAAAAVGSKTVYVTKSGSKYHTADCYMLKSSPRSLTEKQALEEGYEPCGICDPQEE